MWADFGDEFAGGENATPARPLEGDWWEFPEVGFPRLQVHPRHLVDDDAMHALELWRAYRGGGFGGGPLPYSGGYAEQPACLIEAFHILAGAEAALRPKSKKRGK